MRLSWFVCLFAVTLAATNEENLQASVDELKAELKIVKAQEIKHEWTLEQVRQKLLNSTTHEPTVGATHKYAFAHCSATSGWFLFLCIMLGGCLCIIGHDVLRLICEADEEEEEKDKTVALSAQDQINMFERAMTCNFLNVLRTLENWQARDCLPPPPAAVHFKSGPQIGEVDPSKKAVLRAEYEFTLHSLCHWQRLACTVLRSEHVWLKAWLLTSLSGILAYLSQDAVYRGDETIQRTLIGIWTMVTVMLLFCDSGKILSHYHSYYPGKLSHIFEYVASNFVCWSYYC